VVNSFLGRLGIMQGRLLPKYKGRYQAHPSGYWQREFFIAAELGLDLIEFILDFSDVDKNPLMSKNGIVEIKAVSSATGVFTKSVCADYFMEAPLHGGSAAESTRSANILRRLITNCAELGICDIVVPCVDQSSFLNRPKEMEQFIYRLKPLLDLAERNEINIALETDLSPRAFADLLRRFDSNRVTVNYDLGNSAALGYNTVDEFAAFGKRISDIHIKDRKRNGGSVPLGTGDANFAQFFTALAELDYNGPLIFQVYRDEEGIGIFRDQLSWFKSQWESWFSKR
jgi:L-ribulose-5-phosphate 3-epimerase